ncbi:MAG: hypothetical protein ABI193_02650 [Minicystis sp.]
MRKLPAGTATMSSPHPGVPARSLAALDEAAGAAERAPSFDRRSSAPPPTIAPATTIAGTAHLHRAPFVREPSAVLGVLTGALLVQLPGRE